MDLVAQEYDMITNKIRYIIAIGMLLLSPPVFAYPQYKTKEVIATGYAPLDPKAIKGVCYSGDPHITASGRKTTPGITIAASRHIPFGTWIHIKGIGWRRVDDRGKKIVKGRIDICFHTRQEAIEWGKRKVRIYVHPSYHSNESEVVYMQNIKKLMKRVIMSKRAPFPQLSKIIQEVMEEDKIVEFTKKYIMPQTYRKNI